CPEGYLMSKQGIRGRPAAFPPGETRRGKVGTFQGGHEMKARSLRLTVAALVAAASWQASAQQPQGERVRGTIEKLDGSTLAVKTSDGHAMRIKLTDDARIVGVVKASMADIKEGMFIGSAAMPQADGSQKSLEIHIFPEAMRGAGEGHRPYTTPGSTMTNGTV